MLRKSILVVLSLVLCVNLSEGSGRSSSRPASPTGAKTCTINFGTMKDSEPIFLNKNFLYMIPNGNSFVLNSDDTFLIDCGQGRQFKGMTNVQQLTVKCQNGAFDIGNNQMRPDVGDLECTGPRVSELIRVEKTTNICGNDGKIYNIGIQVKDGTKQRLLKLLESCFNEQSKSVFYVKSHILGAMSRGGSPSYSINLGKWVDGSQIPSSYFEVRGIKRAYSSNKLERGHLAPNADYEFAQFRRATYVYFNMVPMERALNGRDWKNLEEHVRNKLKKAKAHATIFTGGFALNDRALAHIDRKVNFLNENADGNKFMSPASSVATIFVPDLVWKVVKVENQAIVFFMFDNAGITQQNYCTNLCPNRRYFCCSVDAFVKGTKDVRGNFNWPTEANAPQTLNAMI